MIVVYYRVIMSYLTSRFANDCFVSNTNDPLIEYECSHCVWMVPGTFEEEL